MSTSNEDDLMGMLGRWQDLAMALGFTLGTSPTEIARKTAALVEAVEAFVNYYPPAGATRDDDIRDRSARLAALRAALAAYRGERYLDPLALRRSIAETLADEHAATQAASAKIQARIEALKAPPKT